MSSAPPHSSRTSPEAGRQAIAFAVKSRRLRSSSMESAKATRAWRPSVSTSRRKVVTSYPSSPSRTFTVPCDTPTGTVRRKRRMTSSGRAFVVRSSQPGSTPGVLPIWET